ncbi:hypothetical protein ABW19_dt0203980 [Dactylella cylindrospora]|nr:hypothetical protein ABW19_dt0203980 [Dactylella cylindrospora]
MSGKFGTSIAIRGKDLPRDSAPSNLTGEPKNLEKRSSRALLRDPKAGSQSQKTVRFQHKCGLKPAGTFSSPSSLAIPKQRTQPPSQTRQQASSPTRLAKPAPEPAKVLAIGAPPKTQSQLRGQVASLSRQSSRQFDENIRLPSDTGTPSAKDESLGKPGRDVSLDLSLGSAPPSSPPTKPEFEAVEFEFDSDSKNDGSMLLPSPLLDKSGSIAGNWANLSLPRSEDFEEDFNDSIGTAIKRK